jgi:hypothetical protein
VPSCAIQINGNTAAMLKTQTIAVLAKRVILISGEFKIGRRSNKINTPTPAIFKTETIIELSFSDLVISSRN